MKKTIEEKFDQYTPRTGHDSPFDFFRAGHELAVKEISEAKRALFQDNLELSREGENWRQVKSSQADIIDYKS